MGQECAKMRRCKYAIYRLWFALIVATMDIVDGNPISLTVIRLERSKTYTLIRQQDTVAPASHEIGTTVC